MRSSRKRKFGVDLNNCAPWVTSQLRQQLGDEHLNKLKKQGAVKEKGRGRIQVSAAEARTVDGIRFDSKWEARVYTILKDRLGPDRLHLQPKFLLQEGFRTPDGRKHRAVHYVADFWLHNEPRAGDSDPVPAGAVVIDAKGHKTEMYKLKKKLFLYRYPGVIFLEPKTEKDIVEALDNL